MQTLSGRNPDGTFTKGSEAAKEAGTKGGHASHGGSWSWGALIIRLQENKTIMDWSDSDQWSYEQWIDE